MAANDKSKGTKKLQKSYFDVLGLCCSSEVPLIEKILKQLEGIKEVSVIVPSRTVIVIHDDLLISQIQIVKALNQARLEANVRVYGEAKFEKKWPNQYAVACGLFLLLSLFKFLYHPMQWFALAAAIVGLPHILYRSIAAIRNYTLDINILMLIAVGGTLALRDFLEAGSIVFLFTIAEWLESRASHKATAVMSSLINMAPQKAVLAENGLVIDAQDVKVNTILAVKAGEAIPIDGVVVEGNCEVDEKALTGESYPVSKQINSTVWAGTINLNGYISVRTTALAEDCIVARMAKLVEEAQNKKSRTQKFIDRCAKYYTPVVVLITIGVASIPAILRVHNLRYWLHLALVVLVSACPCALILSTPVATFCALTKAATDGILIKGGDYLEILAKVKIMAFDKTGTITRGEFMVMDLRSLCPDVSLSTLLYWVSSIESKSSHPMAAALVDYGRSKSIEPNPENVKEFKNFPGEGIYGEIDGKGIYVGNRKIATRAGCQAVPDPEGEDKEGHTIGYIYSEANLVGIFSLSDTCRSGVAEAINELKSLGIRTAMLTGDSHSAAMHAQDQLGNALETVHAEILPEQKAKLINYFKKNGTTAMIGDGINDAPALATADIGVSMGISGSALATETGHVILMSNDLRKIPKAIHLARKTNRKVVENVALSFVTKTAILALAIAGHPLLWAAVLADVGTCLLVILNSMLLLQGTSKPGKKSCKLTCATYAHKHDSKSGCGHLPHGEHDTVADRPDDIHDPCCHSPPIRQRCCSHHEEDQGTTKTKDSDQIKSDSHDIDIHNGKNEVHGCNDTSTDNKHSTFRICDSPKSSATPSCGLNQPVCCSGPSQNMNTITCGGKHIDDQLESGLQVLGERCVDYSHGESGKIKERSCRGCLHDCKDDTERNMLATGHGESTAPYMCVGLEKREIGGCSKSFRKECGCSNRCFGVGLVGGLSEIITE